MADKQLTGEALKAHANTISTELNIPLPKVRATMSLLAEGATVPFIARYRKELTGELDEVQIADIRDRSTQLVELDKRREAIIKSINEQEKMTPTLLKLITAAKTLSALEDLYLPYKQKRKTKASIAREKGLEPLAKRVFDQEKFDIEGTAATFVNTEKGVSDTAEALVGAQHIIAEWINETAEIRNDMRVLFEKKAIIQSKLMPGKEQEAQKYRDYFEWEEPLKDIPSHRLLALRRGEKEMMLILNISPEEEAAHSVLEKHLINKDNEAAALVRDAYKDAYKRLMKPSLETDMRVATKKGADTEAIKVFADNLRELLLSSPLGQKTVLALDPGFRTGCKLVVLDRQGKLLDNRAIYPNEPQRKTIESAALIRHLVEEHKVEAIAIGNGTASRETESFVNSLDLAASVLVLMVNESGASIYSASEVARNEFPDHDITVRGAVSIGRRLMDPLAELVKIDPKSIGVGQYQHDVDQNALKNGLDDTVMSCVNAVGVELNTSSKELLTYVSGLGPSLADNIVKYRNANGPFPSREALRSVPRLGDKVFEQAAGFLRISDSKNQLDRSAVHPERYAIVGKMANDLGTSVDELIGNEKLCDAIAVKKYVSDEVGLPTLKDIVDELKKPGRDPRTAFEAFSFDDTVHEVSDLKIGMQLPGIVTNVTNFGAFVDVGVHQDGLVHVSHLSNKFVSDASTVVKANQKVEVTVIELDIPRKRISLSMKSDPFNKSTSKSTNKSTSKGSSRGKSAESDNRGGAKSKAGNNKRAAGSKKPVEKKEDFASKLDMLKNKWK